MLRNMLIFACLVMIGGGLFARYLDKPSPNPSAPTVAVARAPASETVPVQSAGSRNVTVRADDRGHFQVDARIDGRRMEFMVDTGASVIALRASSARQLGIHPAPREFTANVSTANGSIKAAPATLNMVEIGGLTVRDVRALIIPDEALSTNLLGNSFLSKLRRFEVANGKLVMEQ
jgi:aspartyl protease family protein